MIRPCTKHKLDNGSYTVTYLLSTLACSKCAKPSAYLTSPDSLKYVLANDILGLVTVSYDEESRLVLFVDENGKRPAHPDRAT